MIVVTMLATSVHSQRTANVQKLRRHTSRCDVTVVAAKRGAVQNYDVDCASRTRVRRSAWFGIRSDPKPLDSVSSAVAIAVGILALGGAYTGIVQRFDKLETGQMAVEAGQSKLEAGQSKLEAGLFKLEANQMETRMALKESQAQTAAAMKEFQAETRTAIKESQASNKDAFREFEIIVAVIVAVGYFARPVQ